MLVSTGNCGDTAVRGCRMETGEMSGTGAADCGMRTVG